jgi:FdhD protein
MLAMTDAPGAWRAIEVQRVRDGQRSVAEDRAATEAPLELRLNGQPFVMTMRTPGADGDLAIGFLLAEQVIGEPADIGSITQADDESAIDIALRGAAATRLDWRLQTRRHVAATSACGICGRQTADALDLPIAPISADWTMTGTVVARLPDRLRAQQAVFDHTGGLHAAGLFTADGDLVEIAEDVGRHNAVDKIVGRMLRKGALPLSSHVLCVSGRASFELVQKALVSGIPVLVAVSAPSTMAIDLATRHGLTLVGFTRGDGFNLYTHPWRIA